MSERLRTQQSHTMYGPGLGTVLDILDQWRKYECNPGITKMEEWATDWRKKKQ